MNYRNHYMVPHPETINVQSKEIFVMAANFKELISVDFR